MDQSLLDYVGQALMQKMPIVEIRQQLVGVGWDPKLVDEAIDQLAPSAVSQFVQPEIKASNQDPNAKPFEVKHHRNPWPAITVAVFVLIGLGVVLIGFIYTQNTFFVANVLPTPAPIDETAASENRMQVYSNTEYHFSLQIPGFWSVKEYSKDAYSDGEQRVAFGPSESLPGEVFNDGHYAWIKFYPVSNVKNYKDYKYFMSTIGKGNTKKATLGGVSAVDTSLGIYAEHKGYVYELYLNSEKNAAGVPHYTDESLAILRSFEFTD